jgi:dTDP-L-rhamnose 4-epimerase
MRHVLITGGAGFIGSHLARELLSAGYTVRILDSLDGQVHPDGTRPAYLEPDVELVVGDVRDRATVDAALKGIDAVCHMASAVGVGQSMYEIERYTSVNDIGTAVLLEAMIDRPVGELLVASSMSIYGEGLASGPDGEVDPPERTAAQLKAGRWELRTAAGEVLTPLPTPETKRPTLASIYALNKYSQERMALIWGRAYDRKVTALRFFNAYGPDQALSNPYTGVLAIFGSRLLNGKPPMVFEDGEQRRDFVHVRDVARACRLALETPAAGGEVINVGSGEERTIAEVARLLAAATGRPDLVPHLTGKYRVGDIRHCYADISLARRLIGFTPEVRFEDGLAELAEWLSGQVAVDKVDEMASDLARRGLVA